MKILGLICEYNPFHNGHLHHLNEAKKLIQPDLTVAIVTGYFSMRGELSVLNKEDKVDIALREGIDLVIELPYLLGTQSADTFAYNAVNLLDKIGVTDIVAGSEANNIEAIEKMSKIEQNPEFQEKIKHYIDMGYSYRKAFSDALNDFDFYGIASNDMLNLKYYDAIYKVNPDIKLHLIQRIDNNYLDETLNMSSTIQSASTIRQLRSIAPYVPQMVNDIFEKKGFYSIEGFAEILRHSIITKNLDKIFGAKEGIQNLFTPNFDSIENLVDQLVSKRNKTSRIKRFITYIITNTKDEDVIKAQNPPVRVLGFNEAGQSYLNKRKKETLIVTNIKEGIHPAYDYEIKLAKIMGNVFREDLVKMEQRLPIKKN